MSSSGKIMLCDGPSVSCPDVAASRVEPAEGTEARHRDRGEAIEELPHAGRAQRHRDADRHAADNFEGRDRLAGARTLGAGGDDRQPVRARVAERGFRFCLPSPMFRVIFRGCARLLGSVAELLVSAGRTSHRILEASGWGRLLRRVTGSDSQSTSLPSAWRSACACRRRFADAERVPW